DGILYQDPIDGIPDPALKRIVYDFIEDIQYSSQTVIGVREMRLILAESALQQGDTDGFVTQINEVRALEGLTDYDPDVHAITPRDMLIHTRLVNLFLQPMRRLADMYRFGIPSPHGWNRRRRRRSRGPCSRSATRSVSRIVTSTVPAERMRARCLTRAVAAVLLTLQLAGCYGYAVTQEPPEPGESVRARLTPGGRVWMAENVGRSRETVDGTFVRAQDN